MKAGSYSYFSLSGYKDSNQALRFYTRLSGSILCSAIAGNTVIVEQEYCNFQATPYFTSYQWVPAASPGSYFKDRQLSRQFRLFGDFIKPVRWYQRL